MQPMSPEEIERTIQFLLNHQAQFTVDMDGLSTKIDRVSEAIMGLTGIVGRMAEHVSESQDRIDQQFLRVDEQLLKNAAAQERTDQQLRELARNLQGLEGLFRRHLRDDHGHGPS